MTTSPHYGNGQSPITGRKRPVSSHHQSPKSGHPYLPLPPGSADLPRETWHRQRVSLCSGATSQIDARLNCRIVVRYNDDSSTCFGHRRCMDPRKTRTVRCKCNDVLNVDRNFGGSCAIGELDEHRSSVVRPSDSARPLELSRWTATWERRDEMRPVTCGAKRPPAGGTGHLDDDSIATGKTRHGKPGMQFRVTTAGLCLDTGHCIPGSNGIAGRNQPPRPLQHNSKALTQGVVPNFGLLVGTGAGRRAQDMTELEI